MRKGTRGVLFAQLTLYWYRAHTMSHNCTHVTKTADPKQGTIEIRAEIAPEALTSYRSAAIARIKKDVSLDGFRKGHVPDELLIKHIGEGALLQETADVAISEELPLLLAAEEVPAIAPPKVTVTKLAPGNPLGFTAIVEILPHIELPDVVSIAKKVNLKREPVSVTDQDVEDVLTHLRRERAKIELIEKGESAEAAAEKVKTFEVKDLPPVDDEFVKGLGYESAAQFTEKLRGNIESDRTAQARDKHRVALLDALSDTITIGIPHSLVDHEVHKMEAQFADDLARAGTTFDDYLKQIGKTHHDIHEEWHEPAEKRAKVQLILGEIAVKHNITPNTEEVQTHVAHTLKHHKDVTEERARAYYEHLLRNEAVIQWLETQ